jgi:hypothetical protein
MNGSQSKFLKGTWPMSQIWSDTSLFYLDQDHTAKEKLLVLGTELDKMKHNGNTIWCNQESQERPRQPKSEKRASHSLTHISPNTLRAYTKNHHESTMRNWKTQAFDPTAQKQYRESTCNNFHQIGKPNWFNSIWGQDRNLKQKTNTLAAREPNDSGLRKLLAVVKSKNKQRKQWTVGQSLQRKNI